MIRNRNPAIGEGGMPRRRLGGEYTCSDGGGDVFSRREEDESWVEASDDEEVLAIEGWGEVLRGDVGRGTDSGASGWKRRVVEIRIDGRWRVVEKVRLDRVLGEGGVVVGRHGRWRGDGDDFRGGLAFLIWGEERISSKTVYKIEFVSHSLQVEPGAKYGSGKSYCSRNSSTTWTEKK